MSGMRAALNRLRARALIHGYLWRQRRALGAASPVRRPKTACARMLLDTYKRRSTSVLSGFLVPAELLHLYGVAPMFTEVLAAIMAGSGLAPRALEEAESQGYSRDLCAFHRLTLGAGLSGFLPRFQLIVATSHLCDGQSRTLEELAHRTRAPYLLLDVPQENNPAAVDYLAAQLAELEDKLAALTGRRLDPSDWDRVFSVSNETRDLMLQVNRRRRRRPSPFYGQAAFTVSFLAMLMMGTPFLRDCYRDLLSELESQSLEAEEGDHRIAWLLAYPYFQGNFIGYLENELGVHAVAEELGYVFWPRLDPDQPHRSLALKMLSNPNLGPVSNRVDLVQRLVREYKVDGVLHFSHWGCRQGCGGVRPIADALARLRVPFLELDGDCIDSRNYAPGQTRTRLQGFVELMEKRKSKKPPARPGPGLYLGVDIGSQSAKAVVVDNGGDILFQEILLTGASSRRAAGRLQEAVFDGSGLGKAIRGCVATGYGRLAAKFADDQVTEITCHARGMTHIFRSISTIIDIGGQDTKAIAVNPDGTVGRFVMNDKCAAGTGRFLEIMARTLEVDLEDLGSLALGAERPARISSMCSVFAESEVVSLIAEGTPIETIARGICESIASRTVAMLGRLSRREQVAMSGGVAKNAGVVDALQQLLKTTLKIPQEPQIIGALGAALLARERALRPDQEKSRALA